MGIGADIASLFGSIADAPQQFRSSASDSQCRVIPLPGYIISGLPYFDAKFPRPLCPSRKFRQKNSGRLLCRRYLHL